MFPFLLFKVCGGRDTTSTSGNHNFRPLGHLFLPLPFLLDFLVFNGSNAFAEGLECAICASPTQLLEDGFVFAYVLRPQDVIGPTLYRVCIDFCTKGTYVMI
jgi:hypothetical protein